MVNRINAFVLLALLLVFLVTSGVLAQPAADVTPVGRWRTFDDKTGLERGLVVIEEQAGVLTGRIAGVHDLREAADVCTACKDARKNQPILGMTIITGMRRHGNHWDGGEILDPQSGSTYRCSLRLEDDGTKMIVRGYIGLSLFGRSQTWLRQAG
jgi:uncharacterized protein (DUF2147 family)